jgi:hypothetical protein
MDNTPTPEDLEALQQAMAAAEAAEAAGPRPPLLTGPKRQHYLPRFYLDGFSRDGLVAVYDREKNEIRRQQPKDTTVIGHFYTMVDEQGRKRYEIEALLSEYEGKASPVIKKLAAKESINADERTDLAVFIALGAMRTPDMVDSLKLMNSDMVMRIAKMTFANVDQVAKRLAQDPDYAGKSAEEVRAEAQTMVDMAQNDGIKAVTNEKWAVSMAIRMSMEVAPILAGRNWDVVHRNTEKKSFVTADAPVVLTTVAPRPNDFWGVGFGNADALAIFPLTESCVLLMHGADGGFAHKQGNQEFVRRTNLGVASRCQRFVVGRDEALLRSLADHAGLATTKWQPKMQAK